MRVERNPGEFFGYFYFTQPGLTAHKLSIAAVFLYWLATLRLGCDGGHCSRRSLSLPEPWVWSTHVTMVVALVSLYSEGPRQMIHLQYSGMGACHAANMLNSSIHLDDV